MRRLLVGIAAWTLLLSAAAEAAKLPVYRDPPKYKGVRKPPPLLPQEQPALPTPIKLSDGGVGPHAIVDDAGTAHIVWSEGRGDQDDATVYCRLKRGAGGCDSTTVLTWPKTYGSGDGPQYNTDYDGPRIALAGGQLVVLSKRYPTGSERPDGTAGSSNTIAWTSSDGGSNWSPAQILGTANLGQLAVVPGADTSTVVNSGVDPLCRADGPAGWCLEVFKPGQFGQQLNLSTRSNDNYYPGIALDETGRPVALVENLDAQTVVRRWNGNEPITDAANWTTSAIGVADQPAMTGGPAGAFVMAKAVYNSGPFEVRRLNVQGDGTVATGPPTAVSGDTATFAAIAEDPSGALHAAWQQNTYDGKEGVYIRNQIGGTFTPAQRLIDGMTNGQIDVAATGDGGGFAVLNHTGGVTGEGQIDAVGFGNQSATGKPGLGGLDGGSGPITNVQCQKVGFGKFDIETAAGCFFHGQGQYANVVVSEGEVTINGLRLIPDPGSKIIIDPKTLRFDTTGPIHVLVSSASAQVELFHGEVHRDLSKVVPGTDLFEFPSQAFKANVLGFPVAGDIPVRLESDGVHIPVDLKLPAEFGGFTGHAELIANKSGLQVTSLHIHAGPIPLGALNLKTVDVNWTQGGNWDGHAELEFPATGTLTADISFVDGDFAGASFDLPLNPAQTIGPFVYLLRVNGGFKLKPDIQIKAGATIGAGAPINGTAPVTENGTFTFTFPRQGPAAFDMLGTASIFIFDFAQLHVEFTTDGYAQIAGESGVTLGPVEIGGKLQGWVEAGSGNFSAEVAGGVKLCVAGDCVGPEAKGAMSNEGVMVCGELAGASGGIKISWDDAKELPGVPALLLPAWLVDKLEVPCHTSDYAKPPPRPFTARSSATGGQIVTIPRGLPSATLVAVGDSAAPKITVSGPGGLRLASGEKASARGGVTTFGGIPAAYAVIKNPKPGDYTIAPNADSVDITQVLSSNGYRPATVKVKPRGRTFKFTVANGGNGQRVVFQERGRFGAHTLLATPKTRGTVRIKPAPGPGGRRTVYALVQKDGITTSSRRLFTYVAPAPEKPGAVKRLRAVHKEHKLTVSWRAAARATTYVVKVRGSKGSVLSRTLGKKARGVKFTAVRRDERFTVTVQAIAKDMRAGPAGRAKTK